MNFWETILSIMCRRDILTPIIEMKIYQKKLRPSCSLFINFEISRHINQASENNKTDENTLNSENEAWARITDNFNSQRFSSGSAKRKFLDDPLMDYVDVDDPNSDEKGDCSWDNTAVYESRGNVLKLNKIVYINLLYYCFSWYMHK